MPAPVSAATAIKFLKSFECKGSVITNTCMTGGKYNIPEDAYPTFLQYACAGHYANIALGEKQLVDESECQIAIDLDFKFDGSVKERKITEADIERFTGAMMEELNTMYQIADSDEMIRIHVSQKPHINRTSTCVKDGLHVLVSLAFGGKFARQILYDRMLARMQSLFGHLEGLILGDKGWAAVLDKGVMLGTVPWPVYGCGKPDNEIYRLTYLYEYSQANNELAPCEITDDYIRDNLDLLSVRCPIDSLCIGWVMPDFGKELAQMNADEDERIQKAEKSIAEAAENKDQMHDSKLASWRHFQLCCDAGLLDTYLHHDDKVKIGYALKGEFGDTGILLYLQLCQRYSNHVKQGGKNSDEHYQNQYKSLAPKSSGNSYGAIYNMAKKIDEAKCKELNSQAYKEMYARKNKIDLVATKIEVWVKMDFLRVENLEDKFSRDVACGILQALETLEAAKPLFMKTFYGRLRYDSKAAEQADSSVWSQIPMDSTGTLVMDGLATFDDVERQVEDRALQSKQKTKWAEAAKIIKGKAKSLQNQRKQELREDPEDPHGEYAYWKMEFEQEWCKIRNSATFVCTYRDAQGAFQKYVFQCEAKLITAYGHLRYTIPLEDDKTKTIVYIKKWLRDPKMRCYEDMNIFPPPHVCPKHIFNLWQDSLYESMPIDAEHTDYDRDAVEKYLKHVSIMMNHDQEAIQYYINFWAHVIQKPGIKLGKVIVMIGDEGIGKGMLVDVNCHLLGDGKWFKTSSPERDVWGSFNAPMSSAFLVVLEESDKRNIKDANGVRKDIITAENITINAKGRDQFMAKSFHVFVQMTNEYDPVYTSEGDRRNLIVRCSDEMKGNNSYFDDLLATMRRPHAYRSIYWYLKKIDLSQWHPNDMPRTEYHQTIIACNRSPVEQFIESFVHEFEEYKYVTLYPKDLMVEFVKWCKEQNSKACERMDAANLLKKLKLGSNLPQNAITQAQRTKHGQPSRFDIPKLKQHYGIEMRDYETKHQNDPDDPFLIMGYAYGTDDVIVGAWTESQMPDNQELVGK